MLQTYQYLKLVRLYSEAMCNTTKMIFYSTPLTCELTKENPSNLPHYFRTYSRCTVSSLSMPLCFKLVMGGGRSRDKKDWKWERHYQRRAILMGVVRQDVKRSAGRSGFMGSSSLASQAASWMQFFMEGGRGIWASGWLGLMAATWLDTKMWFTSNIYLTTTVKRSNIYLGDFS